VSAVRIAGLITLAGLALYVAAFPMPSWACGSCVPPHNGFSAFGNAIAFAPIAWFANPLLWGAFVLAARRKPGPTACFGLAAAVVAIVGVLIFRNGMHTYQPLIGVTAWIGSMGLVALGATLAWIFRPDEPSTNGPAS